MNSFNNFHDIECKNYKKLQKTFKIEVPKKFEDLKKV